jgi:predicted patatin/cPLA2 family phospholipase
VLDLLRQAKKVGFLFSGGSSRCVFQIGVVETLYDLGVTPAATLGVSAGSWNAAAVAIGNWRRLRPYWRFFCRMPYIDLGNLLREHSPFIWTTLHKRAFDRYIGTDAIQAAATLPLFIALTRQRDKQSVIVDVRASDDPFKVLLASNFLQPFYTHPQEIEGERYADGGWTDALPYEKLFNEGCDAVVVMASKGESEGGLYRNPSDFEHVISDQRVVVIRPRHRMPIGFVERRWEKLVPIADLGKLRAREVLLGERHPQCDLAARGPAPSAYVSAVRKMLRGARVSPRA